LSIAFALLGALMLEPSVLVLGTTSAAPLPPRR
jgi:hypothetical protein